MAAVNEPYLLAIESAIAGGSIALFKDADFLCGASGDSSVSRAEDLLPRIVELLADAEITVGELNRVAVSRGPGSYTGLRIGIATVMGLCRGLEIEYVGVPVFDAIIETYGDPSSIIALPMGRTDICVAAGPAEIQVTAIDGLKTMIAGSPDTRILAHSDLVVQLIDIRPEMVDIGTNLARFIGTAAFDRPRTATLDPIYIQNPRFGNAPTG